MNRQSFVKLLIAFSLAGWTGLGARALADSAAKARPAKIVESTQWFPDTLTVVFTNRAWYYVPDPVAFKRGASLKDCQRVRKGGVLTLRKGDGSDTTRAFEIMLTTSNSAMLSVHGTLQQKTVPFVLVDP
jgi:hypothetical protein